MTATHDRTVPAAIRLWVDSATDPARLPELREGLAPDVEFDFAGIRRTGADAVLEQLAGAPRGRLAVVPWRLIDRGSGKYTVRFANEDGTPMPSPGGPMAAMDFNLRLDAEGRIALISPSPIHSEPADLIPGLAAGQKFPAATLPDFEGAPVAIIDEAATVNVVVFTSNACPWARGWHDRLQDVVREYTPRGVHFVQVNPNDAAISAPDAAEVSRQRVADGEFASAYVSDDAQGLARRVGARHTPEVFVLDGAGVVVYHGAIDANMEQPELRANWLRDALDEVLAGAEPSLSATPLVGCTIKWSM